MSDRLLCLLAFSLPFAANAQTPCDGALSASFSFTVAANQVTFHDQSVVNISPVHYSWHFGDGNTGSEAGPEHTYADSGLYHVCLTIWAVHENDTCTSTFCHDVHVTHPGTSPCHNALDASFSFTTAGNTVTFHDQSVVNISLVHYSWDFGDGNTGSGEDPIHAYADSGLYHVCLTIWAIHVNDTCTSTFCHDVHVTHPGGTSPCDGALDASFSFTTAANTVTFHDQSVINMTPVHYSWDFGDGNTGNGEDPIHTYADSGLYHVCLTIWAIHVNDTCSSTVCHDVHVTHPGGTSPCDGALDASFSFTTAGNTVTLHDQSVINMTPVHYSWDFGDGNTGNGEDPIHAYADSGLYHVCLTIWAIHVNDTCTSTFCHDVHAVHHGGPQHPIHAAPLPFTDELVLFGANVTDVQRVEIWSSSGQLKASISITSEGPVRLRLASLPAGLYVAHLIGPSMEERVSVVKE